MKNALALALLVTAFGGPSAHAHLKIPQFTLRAITTDGRPVSNAVFDVSIGAQKGVWRFLCGEVFPAVYPCVSWDGYYDEIDEIHVTSDANGDALFREMHYPFSPLRWRAPEVRIDVEGIYIPECHRLSETIRGLSPYLPEGCVPRDYQGKQELAGIPEQVDCPIVFSAAELADAIAKEAASCR
jgi:hypothetical protein